MPTNDMYSDDWSLQGILAGCDCDRLVKETVDGLRMNQAKLKAILDKGVKPDKFKKGQTLLSSYEAAIQGIERAWDKRRPG